MMLGFSNNPPVAPATNSGFSISGLAGNASGLIGNLLGGLLKGKDANTPEYQAGYYLDAKALFPNGVPKQPIAQAVAVNSSLVSGIDNNTLLIGGLIAGGLALYFVTKR